MKTQSSTSETVIITY